MNQWTHVRARNDIEDDLGIYCYAGKVYEIDSFTEEGLVLIECETTVDGWVQNLCIKNNDPDFEFLMRGPEFLQS